MSRPAVDYTLVVTEPDEDGCVCVTSPEVRGLLLYAPIAKALEDAPRAIDMLRRLNRGEQVL